MRLTRWICFALPLWLCCVLFAASPSPSSGQAQLDAGSISGVYFQIRGLDVSWNPIDRLINRFGFWCLDDLRRYDPGGRCRVESELAAFVNSLPHDRLQMTEALTALGAECDGASEKMIDCVYRKRARTYARSTGEAAPLAIMDDIFLFHIAVPRNEEPLDVEVELTRTEEKIK